MFFHRFKELCDERGISIYKAATEIGLNRAAANKWKSGSVPNGQSLNKLADYFGVSTDYLLGNVNDPFFYVDNEKIKAEINSYETERDVLNEVDIAFYDGYRELSEDDKETVRDMVRVMRERRAKKQEK